ncbi:MAG: hypothetical protein LBE97_02430 [Holosporales bacterium]|jgi:hypothetical protein|nr:hypothetical protein [Holosporales bacterium]
MKKWIFISGILACSILFFFSGTLIGYSVGSKNIESTEIEQNRKKRTPSRIKGTFSPLIESIIQKHTSQIQSKIRMPSQLALEKANTIK